MDQHSRRPVRKPTRLPRFDYASAGMYFITICVQGMESRFGEIANADVRLNEAGEMVAELWEENAERYAGIALDAFVVMPDHMHAIVFLGTAPDLREQDPTLSRVVQTFKSITTMEYSRGVREGRYPPYDRVLWQRSFYDKMLRNDRALAAARAYIEANPANAAEKQVNSPFA